MMSLFVNGFKLLVPRLLLMLALVDTFHLISSALTFSIANLSPAYSSHAWYYVVPYSLPVAQVCTSAHSLVAKEIVLSPTKALKNAYVCLFIFNSLFASSKLSLSTL